MSVQGQQYAAKKPSSKRLTIIDTTVDPTQSWEIQRFYTKGISDVHGSQQDTKKVRIKVVDQYWPFHGGNYNQTLSWLFGKDIVVTHKKLNYDVYSGHIDDVGRKTTGYLLDLYVTHVDDRT